MKDPLQNAKKKCQTKNSKMATKYNMSPSGKNILKLFLFETCEQYDIQLTGSSWMIFGQQSLFSETVKPV